MISNPRPPGSGPLFLLEWSKSKGSKTEARSLRLSFGSGWVVLVVLLILGTSAVAARGVLLTLLRLP
jgi:hypothetical protein